MLAVPVGAIGYIWILADVFNERTLTSDWKEGMNKTSIFVYGLLLFPALCVTYADEWPQWRGPSRDGVWAESGLIDKFDGAKVKAKWRVPISSGYSGPTVADGRVYVTDRLVEPTEIERVHCFDWKTGKTLWSHKYDCPYENISYKAGPRASVLIHDGLAYSLGAAGNLFCFDAAKGSVIWSRDLKSDYQIRMPNWGMAASPVIEADHLIVQIGGKDACLVALDRRTGEERWRALSDDASYSAPIVIEQAGRRILVCWTGERIAGLDPSTGQLHWQFDYHWEKWPIGIATPVWSGDKLLISEAHKGSLLLQLAQDTLSIRKLWHRRKEDVDGAMHCLMSTPYIDGLYIYGADSSGVLRCLRLETGEQVWEDESAVPKNRWATIHLVRNGKRTWLFNERGELIIARLTPDGFDEISRAKLLDPTTDQLRRRDGVTWSHPAFAYKHVFARNDKELVCADLSAE